MKTVVSAIGGLDSDTLNPKTTPGNGLKVHSYDKLHFDMFQSTKYQVAEMLISFTGMEMQMKIIQSLDACSFYLGH